MKSLRDIKTACGRRKIQSAVSRSYSFVGSQQNRQQQNKQQTKASYKLRVIKSSPPLLLGVQNFYKPKPELSVDDNDINIQVSLPSKPVQLSVRRDILIIKGEEYCTECLLPFEVQSSVNSSYNNGILHINLKRDKQ